MTDLTKWENYKGLPSEQEEDLYQLFISYLKNKNLQTYDDVHDFFLPGSDTFTEFLLHLESSTEWFDYTQMDEIFDEISLYLEQVKDDEDISDEEDYGESDD